MFYPSSKHHFDIMFVILCVVAGANSQPISNTSKTYINQLNNHYRASFIDFILDASLIKLLHSQNTISKDFASAYSSERRSTATTFHQQSQTVCALLSNLFTGSQMKFCHKHQDVLELVMPQILQLTKKECQRITADLRWNCSAIDFLLDRSNPLAFTKEAALVRSLLNASMMYLVLKACIDGSYRSCGCQNTQLVSSFENDSSSKHRQTPDSSEGGINVLYNAHDVTPQPIVERQITSTDITRLNSGLPLRITNSIYQRQGCRANVGFAYAFTKVFVDSDDLRSLNKAYRILNEERNYIKSKDKGSYVKRLVDSDNKDLAYIKWSKSAINLHNNHIGRQLVREAVRRRCRCHGLSGACQFQTCWDHLHDFDLITSRIRSIYLNSSTKVEVMNTGSLDRPDLSLTRSDTVPFLTPYDQALNRNYERERLTIDNISSHHHADTGWNQDLIYLYESPDYCESQPNISHHGTIGRACVNLNNLTKSTKTSKKRQDSAEVNEKSQYNETERESLDGAPGSCKQLCCNRGYRSELVFHMVTCNCRFKFCCEIECDHCLRQRIQHYCL